MIKMTKKGYTKELLDFFKENNPDKSEKEIIEAFTAQRKLMAERADCNINDVTLSIDKENKTIKIDVKVQGF
jgi:hypothetical protein